MLGSQYDRIVLGKFGREANFVNITGIPQSTVSSWKHRSGGFIPRWYNAEILAGAKKAGIELAPSDLELTAAETKLLARLHDERKGAA